MKRFIVAVVVALFALCTQAFAAAPAPILPADLETAWQKQEAPSCKPTPDKTITLVLYAQPADPQFVRVILITSLNGERVSVINLLMFMGQIPVEATSYVRQGSGWVFYDHQTEEVVNKMAEHERKELGITAEQYASCFN